MKLLKHSYLAGIFLFVILTSACSIGQKHDTAPSYVTDITMTTQIKSALFQQSGINADEIHIETLNGVAMLSGFVSNPDQIAKAGEIAKSIEGVKAVKNNLQVKKEITVKEMACLSGNSQSCSAKSDSSSDTLINNK